MKVELIKPMGKMKVGETFNARTEEQAKMFVEQGFAKSVADDPAEAEKVLVLKNPQPGTYTTEWVEKKPTPTDSVPVTAEVKEPVTEVKEKKSK